MNGRTARTISTLGPMAPAGRSGVEGQDDVLPPASGALYSQLGAVELRALPRSLRRRSDTHMHYCPEPAECHPAAHGPTGYNRRYPSSTPADIGQSERRSRPTVGRCRGKHVGRPHVKPHRAGLQGGMPGARVMAGFGTCGWHVVVTGSEDQKRFS